MADISEPKEKKERTKEIYEKNKGKMIYSIIPANIANE